MAEFPFTHKQIDDRKSDYVCIDCGVQFLDDKQKARGGSVTTFHQGECCLCGKDKSITNIRHYNWLRIPRDKITFDDFKTAVAKESKKYPSLRKHKGKFNEGFLKAAFDAGQSARECCNSMTEEV